VYNHSVRKAKTEIPVECTVPVFLAARGFGMTTGLRDTVFGGAYKDGNLLFVTRYGTLPPICVRCANPVAKPFHKKYSWHPFFIYIFFPVKFLLPKGDKLYEFTTRSASEELELEVYICPKHRANEVLIALAQMSIYGIGLFVFIYYRWAGLLLILASNVGASVLPPRLRPTFIDESHGTFKGAGAAFLDQLTTKPPGVIITYSRAQVAALLNRIAVPSVAWVNRLPPFSTTRSGVVKNKVIQLPR
jgi:hypothetical protein